MADTWLTIEQAAVTLGLSVRTVNRHMAAGKLESRLLDGRREVRVTMPDDKSAASASEPSIDASPFAAVLNPFTDAPTGPAISGHATVTIPPPYNTHSDRPSGDHSPSNFNAETVLALADNAAEKAEMAVTAYQALARSTDVQFQHVRRSARFAWAAVAVMAAGVSVAVGWTTHHLTKAQVQTTYLREQVESKLATTDTLSAERELLRAELSAAKETAARAEGKTSALSDVQARLESDLKEAQARAADAQTREARTRAEWEALLDTTRPAGGPTTKPVSRPSDARADGQDN
jgi:outer membrane murein-binding lipoprotein Lpp